MAMYSEDELVEVARLIIILRTNCSIFKTSGLKKSYMTISAQEVLRAIRELKDLLGLNVINKIIQSFGDLEMVEHEAENYLKNI